MYIFSNKTTQGSNIYISKKQQTVRVNPCKFIFIHVINDDDFFYDFTIIII